MRIAFLGATSQIAQDLVLSYGRHAQHDLYLYARRPGVVRDWLTGQGLPGRYPVAEFSAFAADQHFDAIINFVGVGNPARAMAMGESIFDITEQYDELALAYVRKHPECRYVFLSSGAAYGGGFLTPVDETTVAQIPINRVSAQDWYGVAKLYAECRHRALADLPIIDVRVFSYISSSQDIDARFLVSDALRAIRTGTVLETSTDNVVRDYIGPEDFYSLLVSLLSAEPGNDVVDCYTLAPIDKLGLLDALKERYGLNYVMPAHGYASVNATGAKINYFSRNRRAAKYGYSPRWSSLDTVLSAVSGIVGAKSI